MVLVGNHFGTKIEDNQFLGGAQAFKITAAPTETPDIWGWSHAPFLGAIIEGNTIGDALDGGTISVEHSQYIKSDAGRVYFSGTLADNTVTWSSAFLAAHPNTTISGLIVGVPGSLDPGEMVLSVSGNVGVSANATSPTLDVVSATINGSPTTNQTQTLPPPGPPAPASLQLVVDSGSGTSDDITNDGELSFTTSPDAAGYEYRLSGSTTYLPVTSPSGFLPAGLVQGANVVDVRGFDAAGNRGPDASITFTMQTAPPAADPPSLATTNAGGTIAVASPVFGVAGDAGDTIELMRNGAEVAERVGPGTLTDPASLANGAYSYSLHRVDVAGNASDSPAVSVTIAVPAAVVIPPTPTPTPSPTPTPVVSPTPTPTPAPPLQLPREPGWARTVMMLWGRLPRREATGFRTWTLR